MPRKPPAARPGRKANREDFTMSMSNAVADYVHFMCTALLKMRQTGAIVPSQRFLISKMLAPIPESYSGRIIELGSGSGALTVRLAARCPEARILACEINPALARNTRHNLDHAGINGRVKVISDSAEHLLSEMERKGTEKVDYVLSGIPIGNLPGDRTLALVEAIRRVIRPGGLYIQFQYSLMDRKRIRSRFQALRTVPVLLNIPPAVVYYAQR
jgi:phospholipid N-methyltransferase